MARFGASPAPADGSDPCRAFYSAFRDFAAAAAAAHLRRVASREKAAKEVAKALAKKEAAARRAAKAGRAAPAAAAPAAAPAAGDLQADLRNALKAPRLRKAVARGEPTRNVAPPGADFRDALHTNWSKRQSGKPPPPKENILAAFAKQQDMSAADIVKNFVKTR